jgi:putative spermidine/putrescine transport system permease protein
VGSDGFHDNAEKFLVRGALPSRRGTERESRTRGHGARTIYTRSQAVARAFADPVPFMMIPGSKTGPREAVTAGLLITPAALTIIALFVVPIGYILLLSVTDPVVSLDHYRRLFTIPLYANVMINTFKTSLIVTVACLLLGYPLAYVMARRNDMLAGVLLAAVGLSFWTGFVVRSYAWLVILGNKGPVAAVYAFAGWGRPPQLLFTPFASTLGMTHILLPFMVLALYGVMRKIDLSYLRAAEGLGARPLAGFAHVFLPLSLPGVVNGSLLVFTMCLGFYITPILLGTPKDMMISQLINQQIEDLLAWGFASAIAVVLLACSLVLLLIYNRFAGFDRLWG